jgi:hypothetical protein
VGSNEFILKGINWLGINRSHIPYSNDHSKGTDTHAMTFGLHVQQLNTNIIAINQLVTIQEMKLMKNINQCKSITL